MAKQKTNSIENANVIPLNSISGSVQIEDISKSKPQQDANSRHFISRRFKYITTLVMCYIMFAFGINDYAIGPTVVDFKYIFDVPLETVTLQTTFQSIGYCLGSISGFVFKYVNRQLTCIIMLTIVSIAVVVYPHAPSIAIFYSIVFIWGLGNGVWVVAKNVWFIEMWQEKSNMILQLIEFVYGLGTISAPLIERPFLTGELRQEQNKTKICVPMSDFITEVSVDERRAKLTLPFAIFSFLLIIGVIMMSILFFIKKYVPPSKQILQMNNEETKLFEQPNSPKFLVLSLATLSFSSYMTSEVASFIFLPTFSQYIKLKLSASEAASVHSSMAIAYTLGRGISSLVAIKMKPEVMLAVHYCIIIAAEAMFFCSTNSLTLLWMANITLGIGQSAILSATFAHIEHYLVVSNRTVSVMVLSMASFSSFLPYFIGKMMLHQPLFLIFINSTFLLISLVTFIIIRYLVKFWSSKIHN